MIPTDEEHPHRFEVYPSFFRVERSPDSSTITYLDGWAVEPTGDADFDRLTGEVYADAAVLFARDEKNPAAIAFVISCILNKARSGALVVGPLECGFIDRISKLAFCGSLN